MEFQDHKFHIQSLHQINLFCKPSLKIFCKILS